MAARELRFTDNLVSAAAEIAGVNGRIPLTYTNRVFVVEFPDGTDTSRLRESRQDPPADLDRVSRLAAAAWQAPKDMTTAADDGLDWDETSSGPPDLPSGSGPGDETREGRPLAPTSLYLTGSVAIAIVVVSGEESALQFSDAEVTDILSEVTAGVNFLDSAQPEAKLSFTLDVREFAVTAQPCTGGTDYEACEAPWRDAVLDQLEYPISPDFECHAYAEALRTQQNTNWAFIAFLTKYPLVHFAYAGSTKITINYSETSDLTGVFVHEVCHVFGALDEYRAKCPTCGLKSGYLQAPNNNCVSCPGVQARCVMRQNALTMCEWTRKQIGWDPSLYPQTMDMRNYVPTGMKTGDSGRWDVKGIWWLPWKNIGTSAEVKMLSKTELHIAGPYEADFGTGSTETGEIDIRIWGFHDGLRFCNIQVVLTGHLASAAGGPNVTRFDSGVTLDHFSEQLPDSTYSVPYVAYGTPAVVTQAAYVEETFWYPSVVFTWSRPDGSVVALAFEDTSL